MVENIQEIEPVVKREAGAMAEEKDDEESRKPVKREDPAQMKLEL
mgnify:CR=1 FL=1